MSLVESSNELIAGRDQGRGKREQMSSEKLDDSSSYAYHYGARDDLIDITIPSPYTHEEGPGG